MPKPPTDHQPCCGVSTDLEDYFLNRRQFLNRMGMGLGALSLTTLLDPSHLVAAPGPARASNPLAPKAPMFPAKAKAVIHIFAQGAPSHIDTWDPKPELSKMDGRTLPDGGIAMGSPFKFTPMGALRDPGERSVPAAGRACRRHGDRALDAHRHSGPRGGHGVHEHGLPADREAEPGLLGGVRPGHRKPEPARLHRAAQRRAARRAARRTTGPAFCRASTRGRASTCRRRTCSR